MSGEQEYFCPKCKYEWETLEGYNGCPNCEMLTARKEYMIKEVRRIIPYEILDNLKPNWYIWKCQVELNNGKFIQGSVQADYLGELIAEETLEID